MLADVVCRRLRDGTMQCSSTAPRSQPSSGAADVPAADQEEEEEMLRGWERKAWLERSNAESQVSGAKHCSGVSRRCRLDQHQLPGDAGNP